MAPNSSGGNASAVQSRLLDDRYELGELTQSTGLLDIYSGLDTLLERPVEIKMLRPEYARERGFRLRFRKEAQAASRLSHPSIVRVYDTGETEDERGELIPYVVSEASCGTRLTELMAAGGITPTHAFSYTSGILDALEYAHRAGVLHRDVSPANVFVTDEGEIKLANFGIARAVADTQTTLADATRALGSADYFSPEQAKGDPVDARSDLYGAGAVLYKLLTGRPPFEGSTPIAVAYQHMNEAPKPPSKVTDAAPASLDRVVLQSLAKDPTRRPTDAGEFRRELRDAATGSAPSRHEVDALTSELYGPSARNAAETARSLRQLSTDTTMSRTQSGPPVAWVWAGVLILAAIMISVLFWAAGIKPEDEEGIHAVTMIDVAGDAYERAKAKLEAESLVVERFEESSPTVPEGRVTRTAPSPGTILKQDGEVDVWVSTGPSNVAIPEILGLSQQNASSTLAQAGLQVGRVIPVVNLETTPLTVLSLTVNGEEVAPGDELPEGTQVDMTIAAMKTALTDMTGWTVERAETRAKEIGLVPVVADDTECAATNPRTVSSMSHNPGDLEIGTEITLYTCSS